MLATLAHARFATGTCYRPGAPGCPMIGFTLLLACTSAAPPAAEVPPAPTSPPAPVATRADAANTKVPPDLGGLRFEERAVIDPTEQLSARAVVPAGWVPKNDGFPGWFVPPKEADLGWMTSYKIGTNCAGTCEPKDWKAVVDGQMVAHVPDKELLHEEALPEGGRIRWGGDAASARVYAAWYRDGASHYQECSANLDSAAMVKAIDAFVEACRATRFDGG